MVPPAATRPSPLLAANGLPVSVPGLCNSVAFAQVPGHSDYFLGRLANTGKFPQACEDIRRGWALGLFKMDWNTHTLNFDRFVLRPPAQISAGSTTVTLGSAYDPSVIFYNNELWVAFECSGPGYGGWSCIGPLDWKKGTIDISRTNIIVSGHDSDPKSPFRYSASVPGIFVFQGHAYLYWTAIQVLKSNGAWQQATVRGMELAQEPGGLRRFWGAASIGKPVPSHDPEHNVEVLGLEPADPNLNQFVDFGGGVLVAHDEIYLIAAIGGRGPQGRQTCLSSGGTSYGCSRPKMFRSAQPLAKDGFNATTLASPQFPLNPGGYQRAATAPDGTLKVIGEFFPPKSSFTYPRADVLPLDHSSMLIYPLDLSSLEFSH